MNKKLLVSLVAVAVLVAVGIFSSIAYANHSWGGYHWARNANPLNLKLGDNVSATWDGHLITASGDWSVSSMLDTIIVTGQSKGNCKPTKGRVEVCDKTYGNNGWLGLAQIWVSGSHITQGVAKMNDTYFNIAPYNTAAWRQFVICQEVGHTFGLGHQDEVFNNTNLGTCMDYTNDPDGTIKGQLSNEHPNIHDYDQLDTIYAHLDAFTSALSSVFSKKSSALAATIDDIDTSDAKEWGNVIRKSSDGRSSLHERDLGKGNKVFTFVIWAN
ncbi:MAG: hypothetical protein Q8R55_03615 [Candidatus Taylorbacteria bacterium]|nr:hypothetical protein [Candidatus Taylorbacteria bacterium]